MRIVDPEIRQIVEQVRSSVLSHTDESRAQLEDLLERPSLAEFDRGALLMCTAIANQHQSDPNELLAIIDEAITLLEGDETDMLSSSLSMAAVIAAMQGDLDRALQRSMDFMAATAGLTGRQLPAKARVNYSTVLLRIGAFDVASDYLIPSLIDTLGAADERVVAVAVMNLLLATRGELVMRPVEIDQLTDSKMGKHLTYLVHTCDQLLAVNGLDLRVRKMLQGVLANISMIRGELDIAVALWGDLDSMSPDNHPVFVQYFRVVEARLAAHRGEPGRAHELLDAHFADAAAIQIFAATHIEAHTLRAELLAEAGDHKGAYEAMTDAVRTLATESSLIPDGLIRELARRSEVERQQKHLLERTEELDKRSRIDQLTGLGNRRALDRNLADLARKPLARLAVILIDIDFFKAINDDFGHAAGDDTLVALAGVLQRACRATDLVVRFGGEEFVIIPDNPWPAGALQLAERIRSDVAGHPWASEGLPRPITCSVGVAAGMAIDADEVIAEADKRMYEAKREGRNQVCAGLGVRL